MKSLSPALAAHYAGEVTRTATLWQISRRDGVVTRFTDLDEDVTVDGLVYKSNSGFTPTAIQTSSDLAVDNLDVDGLIEQGLITHDEVLSGALDAAEIRVSRVCYELPSAGVEKLRRGFVGEVKLTDSGFTAELRGIMQLLQQPLGRILLPECDADLGDARCGVDLEDFTQDGIVEAPADRRGWKDSGLMQPAGYFAGGVLTWLTGANASRKMEVKSQTEDGLITLCEQMFDPVSPGDTYRISAGCDKTRATCKDKFENVRNFRGFPDIPGQDFVVSNKK